MNRVLRIASFLFAVILIVSCTDHAGELPEVDSGSNEELDLPFTPEGLLFYEVIDGKITVTDCTNAYVSEIAIPDGVEVIVDGDIAHAVLWKREVDIQPGQR